MCCPLQYYKKRIKGFQKYPRMVKAYLRAGQKYRDTLPNAVRTKEKASVYEWFFRDVFCKSTADFERMHNSMFGKPDYKKLLEDFFGIDLTL